eukprot:SAG22_NODE_1345_length_4675_cov_2.245629_3_plen_79_part_00
MGHAHFHTKVSGKFITALLARVVPVNCPWVRAAGIALAPPIVAIRCQPQRFPAVPIQGRDQNVGKLGSGSLYQRESEG